MNYFADLDVLGAMAGLIAAVPGAIGPTLALLAIGLGLFACADRAVDATGDDQPLR